MARIKSASKQECILQAATKIFAERGVWSTPTAAISAAAGVAEGTLFTYFRSKDELINNLYREIKTDLAEQLLSDMPKKASIKEKLRHIWQHYVKWGLANQDKYKVLVQLRTSDKVSDASKVFGNQLFVEIENMARKCIDEKILRNYPLPFIAGMFSGLAETTMSMIMLRSNDDIDYCSLGFEVFWRGFVNEANRTQ